MTQTTVWRSPWPAGISHRAIRLLPALLFALPLPAAPKDSCVECHSVLADKLQTPAAAFSNDVHQHRGFGCADCHGGDRTSDDPGIAMSRAKGFIGTPARTAVPKLCARCHSDAALMHRYRPQQRVDQYAQYLTSVHGKRMAAGDAAAANCVDCHSVHDIREVKDPLSPVYPLRLPETCARCHSDAAHMAKYKIPTAQHADYRKSVHWKALQGGDLSAPSCASCHGNHGATPPQVTSVANVCGTCHALMEDLYNKSPHQPVFAAMGVAGCVTCHGNHEVLKPTSAMLAGDKAVCAQCHEADSGGGKAAAEMAGLIARLQSALDESNRTLERASNSGMEVSEAVLRQREAEENLVKARVAVHAFRVAAVGEPVNAGLKIAAGTRQAGEDALRERDFRRMGLGVALLAIVITIAGLWLALRAVEKRQVTLTEPGGK
jgi:predicted CXXCH cytochrome family protein